MTEELVTLVMPWTADDVYDVFLGKRVIRGRAEGVPLPVAEKIVRERGPGYYIHHPVTYVPIERSK